MRLVSRGSVFAVPAFSRLWLAFSVSAVGGSASLVAMPVLVFQLSGGNPLLTALPVATGSGAYLLWGLIAGAVADRYGRKRVLLLACLVDAVVLTLASIAVMSGSSSTWMIVAVSVVVGSSGVFSDAAAQGAAPSLVPHDLIPAATSAISVAHTVVGIVVPAIAGALLLWVSPGVLIAADALCSIVAILLLLRVPLRASSAAVDEHSMWTLIKQGVGYVFSHRGIRSSVLVGIAQSAFVGAVLGQFVVFASDALRLSPDDGAVGLMWTAWSVGGLIAVTSIPRMLDRIPGPRVILLATPVASILALLIAQLTNWIPAVVAIAGLSIALSLTATVTVIYRQMNTPEEMLSRVGATGRMLAWGIGNPTGAILGGVVATTFGASTVFMFAAALGVIAAATGWLSPLRGEAFPTQRDSSKVKSQA